MKKYLKWIIGIVLLIALIVVWIVVKDLKVKEFKNDDFKIRYDATWKFKKEKEGIKLIHKKTKSVLKVNCLVLDQSLNDTELKDVVEEVIYDIQNQNEGFELINTDEDSESDYENYSYLYEKDDEQVLVKIYKKGVKLIIVYFDAASESFDVVLDNVDTILSSLEIFDHEKID